MGFVCRKAVWGAALLLWLMPTPGLAASGVRSGKTDKALGEVSSGRPRRVIVRVKPGAKNVVKSKIKRRGGDVYGEHTLVPALSARLGPEAIVALASDPDVESLSLDAPVRAFASKKSSSAGSPGFSDSGSATIAEVLGLGQWFSGASITVAVIDSGLQDSADFSGRILDFYDFTSGRGPVRTLPYDDYGHGTHVAGLIGSSGVSSSGKYRGVAPGIRFLPLKVLDKKGVGKTSEVIQALEFAVANKARFNLQIVNLSLGHPIYESAATDPLVQAVEAAVRAGLMVVVASGNKGMDAAGTPGYGGISSPGNAPSAITVGAANTAGTIVRTDDRVAAYSSRGPSWYDGIAKPDILAPAQNLISNGGDGTEIAAVYPWLIVQDGTGSKYLKLSGSSMATGVVSGLAALLIEANAFAAQQRWEAYQDSLRRKDRTPWPGAPALTPNAVKAMLQYTATPLRDENGLPYDALAQGAGLVNGLGAMTLAYCTDTNQSAGTDWLVYSPTPITAYGGVSEAWSESLIWGTRVLRGNSLIELNQSAWSEGIVWGTGDLDERSWAMVAGDGENIVWGTSLSVVEANWFGNIEFGENIVWGTALNWAENIVWGTGLLGFFDGENIVWGTALGWGENIVWGTLSDENIVWGTSNKVTVLGSTLAGGDR
jgi:serine protease AprX